MDRNPSYPKAISDLKRSRDLAVKRGIRASQAFRAFHSAWRTLQGIETMNIIRKEQARCLAKNDIAGQAAFVGRLYGLTTL